MEVIYSNPFVELGKAAPHLKRGACISFHGKERDVSTLSFRQPHFTLMSNPRLTLMKCSLRPISLRVGFINRSNSSPLPSFRVPLLYLLLQRERALRKFVPPSVAICSQLGHSEFKLVVIIDDSDSVSLEQVLITDLLKLYFFL